MDIDALVDMVRAHQQHEMAEHEGIVTTVILPSAIRTLALMQDSIGSIFFAADEWNKAQHHEKLMGEPTARQGEDDAMDWASTSIYVSHDRYCEALRLGLYFRGNDGYAAVQFASSRIDRHGAFAAGVAKDRRLLGEIERIEQRKTDRLGLTEDVPFTRYFDRHRVQVQRDFSDTKNPLSSELIEAFAAKNWFLYDATGMMPWDIAAVVEQGPAAALHSPRTYSILPSTEQPTDTATVAEAMREVAAAKRFPTYTNREHDVSVTIGAVSMLPAYMQLRPKDAKLDEQQFIGIPYQCVFPAIEQNLSAHQPPLTQRQF